MPVLKCRNPTLKAKPRGRGRLGSYHGNRVGLDGPQQGSALPPQGQPLPMGCSANEFLGTGAALFPPYTALREPDRQIPIESSRRICIFH